MKQDAIVHSLRYLYLRGMLAVLLPTLLAGLVISYFYASHNIRITYDLNLLDDANDLLHQVKIHRSGDLELDLPLAARQMLMANNDENVLYAVWDDHDSLLSGSTLLFSLAGHMSHEGSQQFDDITLSGHSYRMIWKRDTVGTHTLCIAVAQTTLAIDHLVLGLMGSFLLLGSLLVLIAAFGIVVGVRQGLVPILALRATIADRSPNDFSTLAVATAPVELQPVIHGINELLRKLEKSVMNHRRFVADAAHQLRTPLAVLTSRLETALLQANNRDNPLLSQLLDVTRRTSHLANQLLSLSRLENSGMLQATLHPLDLVDVIRESARHFVVAADQKNIQLGFELDSCSVNGDRLLLEEVIGNLLDNACRYSSGNQVQVTLCTSGHYAELVVEDNGTGISPEALHRLGEPFYRAGTTDSDGCGLGLAIVNEIIALHRGSVRYMSGSGGRGLRVVISIPLTGAAIIRSSTPRP